MLLEFKGGPWDGGNLSLEDNKTDVGYKLEWAIRLREGGGDHLYESSDVVLEDSESLTLEYRGCIPLDESWMPGWSSREDSDELYLQDEDIDWGEE